MAKYFQFVSVGSGSDSEPVWLALWTNEGGPFNLEYVYCSRAEAKKLRPFALLCAKKKVGSVSIDCQKGPLRGDSDGTTVTLTYAGIRVPFTAEEYSWMWFLLWASLRMMVGGAAVDPSLFEPGPDLMAAIDRFADD